MKMRHKKHADGTFHIHGKRYRTVRGSRAQVMHGNAYKTVGDLKKDDMKYNKTGKIVSRRKSERAKKEKRLQEHGYFTEKGKFGAVRKEPKTAKRSKKHKNKTRKR
tara:strand:+ start:7889 stop:8206 length:318 start_codon:yes stop_codon:yes gene_type:complete